MEEFACEVFNYGLRNLKTSGILNPRKPYLFLFLKSLVPYEYQGDLDNIKTQPQAGGANPTFASKIRFRALMPSADVFCPSLQCAVYDYLIFGLSQPLIGNLSIPLGLIYRAHEAIRANERKCEEQLTDLVSTALSASPAVIVFEDLNVTPNRTKRGSGT